jgi:hypothetical protein
MITSRSIILRIKKDLDKRSRENQNSHFTSNNCIPKSRAIYEITRRNMLQLNRPQVTIWRMRIAWWITKVTDTRSHTHTHTHNM